jgi:hypothetical protein
MRLTASLPIFTRLRASVTPAILRTGSQRGTSQDRFFHVARHALYRSKTSVTNSPSRHAEPPGADLARRVTRLRVYSRCAHRGGWCELAVTRHSRCSDISS